MKNEDLNKLKKEYIESPIPKELDFHVKKALKNAEKITRRRKDLRKISITAASIAICAAALTIGVNSSPVFAQNLSKVPFVGSIVKVITFKEYTINQDKYKASLKTPSIQGLDNKTLENSINEKYLTENKKLYDQFNEDMKKLKEKGGGHLGVDSGYTVKTDNDNILSVGRYVVNTVGSSSTTMKYDTIDKKNQVLITLPSLFKDNSYVNIISDNIKKQMVEQMKADKNKTYWIHQEGISNPMDIFDKISDNQNFYINPEGKLVISFNKYEVAPGAMGVVEFVIPTDVIHNNLVGNEYIK